MHREHCEAAQLHCLCSLCGRVLTFRALFVSLSSNKLSSSKLYAEFNSSLQQGQHINRTRFDEVLQALAQADFISFDKHKGTVTRR